MMVDSVTAVQPAPDDDEDEDATPAAIPQPSTPAARAAGPIPYDGPVLPIGGAPAGNRMAYDGPVIPLQPADIPQGRGAQMPAAADQRTTQKPQDAELPDLGSRDFDTTFKKAAATYGVNPAVLKSIANQESGFDPSAIGPDTRYGRAQGMMQLMPQTAKWVGVTDPFDPEQNIWGGARYLSYLKQKFGSDAAALAAYNWGEGNLKKWSSADQPNPDDVPQETRDYVTSVYGNAGLPREDLNPLVGEPTPIADAASAAGTYVKNVATSAAQGAVEGTGAGLKGIGALSTDQPYLAPYYPTYQKFAAMTPDQQDTVYETVADDKAMPISAKAALLKNLRAVADGDPVKSPEDFAGLAPADVPISKVGAQVEQYGKDHLTPDAGFDRTLSGRVASSIGNIAPGMAATVLGGPILGGAYFGAQTAADEGDLAAQQGATPEQQAAATRSGQALGSAAGLVNFEAVMAPLAKLGPGALGWAGTKLAQAARSGITFAGVGEAQEWLANQFRQDYDPAAHYDFDPKRLETSLLTGALLGAAHPAGGKQQEVSASAQPTPDAAPAGPYTSGFDMASGAYVVRGPDGETVSSHPDVATANAQADALNREHAATQAQQQTQQGDAQGQPPALPAPPAAAAALPAPDKVYGDGFTMRDKVPADDVRTGLIAGPKPPQALPGPDQNAPALPPPQGRSYGDGFSMRDPAPDDAQPPAPPAALPAPDTLYGDGFTAGAQQLGTPLDKGKYALANMQTGDTINVPQLGMQAGLKGNAQARDLMQNLANRGLAQFDGRRWTRTDTPVYDMQQPAGNMQDEPQNMQSAGPAMQSGAPTMLPSGPDMQAPADPIQAAEQRGADEAAALTGQPAAGQLPPDHPVEQAAAQVNTAPSDAQRVAGNYAKGHVNLHGLDISIENPRGSERSGVDAQTGEPWSVQMPDHYGYIKRTEGADGDHVDTYVGPNPDSRRAFVVDQVGADDGKFDEHKVMLGYPDRDSATAAYHAAFSDGRGPDRMGAMSETTIDGLKDWIRNGDTTKPFAGQQPEGWEPFYSSALDYARNGTKPLNAQALARHLGVERPLAGRLLQAMAVRGDIRVTNGGGFARVPRSDKPQSLLQFIAGRGGIKDPGGELAAMNAQRLVPGKGMLVRPRGVEPDYVREAATEAGYLPEGASINDLHEAIRREVAGQPVYSERDLDRVLDQQQVAQQGSGDEASYLRNRARELGLVPGPGWTPADIAQAIAEREAIMGEDDYHRNAGADRIEQDLDALLAGTSFSKDGLGDDFDIPFHDHERDHQQPAREVGQKPAAPEGAEGVGRLSDRSAREGGSDEAGARAGDRGGDAAAQSGLTTEKVATADGQRDQFIITGTEVTARDKLDALSRAKLTGGDKPMDEGLFGGGHKQADLMDVARAAPLKPLDHGELNLPLSARGDIDKQLDRYKADQAKIAREAARDIAATTKQAKAQARALFDQHADDIVKTYGGKLGTRAQVRKTLDQMVKWEPEKFIKLVEKFKAEKSAASDVPTAFHRSDSTTRLPFAKDFPSVVIQQPDASPVRVRAHPDYQAAKAGDTRAAFSLVKHALDDKKLAKIRSMIGDRKPIVVPVHAEEAAGRNKIPNAYAHVLADRLGLEVSNDIVQANRPQRTGKSALYRMTSRAEFDGKVEPGKDYLLVDDHITQGGTLADLRSYIERNGGKVVGATTLTGNDKSARLAPLSSTIERLRERFPGLEQDWKDRFGHGFDSLTQSEAVYLDRFNSAKSIRDTVLARGSEAFERGVAGADRGGQGKGEDRGRVARGAPDRAFSSTSDDISDLRREAIGHGAFVYRDPATQAERFKAQMAMNGLIRKMAGDNGANVRVVDHIATPDGGEAHGAFIQRGNTIFLSLRNLADMAGTARHEGIHLMRATGALDDRSWGVLRDAAERDWRQRFGIDQQYAEDAAHWRRLGMSDSWIQDRLNEEAVAFAATAQGDGTLAARGPIGRALNLVNRFLSSVRNMVAGRGFRSGEGVLDDIAAGRYAQGDDAASSAAMPAAAYDRAPAGAAEGTPPAFERSTAPETTEEQRDTLARYPSIQRARDYMGAVVEDLMKHVAPMSMRSASDRARAVAKDFANSIRKAHWQTNRLDDFLKKNFTPEQRVGMWNTMDEASVAASRIFNAAKERADAEAAAILKSKPNGASDENLQAQAAARSAEILSAARSEAQKAGNRVLRGLPDDQRMVIEEMSRHAQGLWQKAVDAGMVQGEGLPFWTPRMGVLVGEDGTFGHLQSEGEGAPSLDSMGRNLTTNSPNLKGRKYLTAEETEQAMRDKFGPGAELVRDIRTMPLAMGRLERAIAGREMVNSIKDIGDRVGTETVSDADKPEFFTLDHPALKTFKPKVEQVQVSPETLAKRNLKIEGRSVVDADGNPRASYAVDQKGGVTQSTWAKDDAGNVIYERQPLFISKEFEGPLRAVLTSKPNGVYNALMAIKGRAMGLIMYSPLIHNMVEYGRALPVMPGKVLTFRVYGDGKRALADHATMREAIEAGLAPIGHRGQWNDITSIMEEPNLKPGRSWTAQGAGWLADSMTGGRAGDPVRRAIDTAGDWWHNRLLWDQVAKLQMGLYVNVRDSLIDKGQPREAATKIAAHFANRYAGALPAESMGEMSRRLTNLALFSRTFTIGNLGVMKDMMTGLPPDVMAQLKREIGPEGAASAAKVARRKAIGTFMLDVGLMLGANAMLQTGANLMMGQTMSDQERALAKRFQRMVRATKENPWHALSPALFAGTAGAVTGGMLGGTAGAVKGGAGAALGALAYNAGSTLSPTADNEQGKDARIKVGHDKNGTAIYARFPMGKVGEEFVNWLTSPMETMKKKVSTFLRPTIDVATNDAGFGPGHRVEPVYDPNGSVAKMVGQIAWHFLAAQAPGDVTQLAWDKLTGEKVTDIDKLKAIGPLAGITFSKGAPGGEAMGAFFAAQNRHDIEVQQALPAINKKLRAGDLQGAVAQMQALGMDRAEIKARIRGQTDPGSRMTNNRMKKFRRFATPDEKDRMADALGQD